MIKPELNLRRRQALALGVATLASWRALAADVVLPDIPPIPAKLKGSGELRIAAYGGTAQDAERKAYFQPFEAMSGIKVHDFPGADLNKVKAMVDTGTVEWDVMQLSQGSVANLRKHGDYFEKIDYDLVDTANIASMYRSDYACDMLVWSEVMAYRTDAFNGAVPVGWADFWDTKKFPGDRALGGAGPSTPELEFALMAAGVPPEKVYPIDIDKAFASYDNIKSSVVKWWETGAVPVQMLTDKDVVLTSVWNGRMAAIQAAGVPAAISWDQGMLKRDCWAVPKGSPNKANAMKFIAFSTMAVPQARLSSLIPYGFVNSQSPQYVAPKQLAVLPSAPEIKSKLVPYDYAWWAQNRDAVIAHWNKWVLS
ncbi:MAG TPA: ABC transporter substrate-binding protein [Acetobacteraceae bacterium]|nr:ABC transporter substrate-binding protein [Acetobacteraceae bacterium]